MQVKPVVSVSCVHSIACILVRAFNSALDCALKISSPLDRLEIQPVGQLNTNESIIISHYNKDITWIVAI